MVQKSQTTTWDVYNLVNNGIYYLSTGAGFQPSTVGMCWDNDVWWLVFKGRDGCQTILDVLDKYVIII